MAGLPDLTHVIDNGVEPVVTPRHEEVVGLGDRLSRLGLYVGHVDAVVGHHAQLIGKGLQVVGVRRVTREVRRDLSGNVVTGIGDVRGCWSNIDSCDEGRDGDRRQLLCFGNGQDAGSQREGG